LDGNVHAILDRAGRSREKLMRQLRDLLADWVIPVPSEEAAPNSAG
jgi:hypothetical protein